MAIAPIVIDLLIKGMPQVQQSFKSVQDAALRAERSMQREAERAEKARVASATREARAKERQFAKVAHEADRWSREQVRSAERAEKEKERIAERHAREQVRIHREATREVERIEERAHAATKRRLSQETREREREAARWVKLREQEQRQEASSRARFATGIVGSAARGVMSGMQRVGGIATGLASTAAQLGGGFSIADSVAQRGDLQRSAVQLSNSAFIPGKNQRPDVGRIVDTAKAASVSTGVNAGELVEATKAYVAKSADFDGGMKNMEFFGQIAKGTGTGIEDVAKTAGILRVQNKNLDDTAMKQMLLDVIMQGKQGSVEFEDLAKVAGKITRTSSSYAGNQTDNQRRLLGLSQIAIRTSGSPEEAGTVLSNISADAMKHSKDVGAVIGKDFLTEKGQIAKAPEEFLADVMEKTGGNMQKIQGMGFGMRSMKMFQALAPVFNEAETAAGGGKAGLKAGRAAILSDMKSVTGASYSEEHLRGDLKAINDSAPEKFATAVRELKMAVGDELLPEFMKLIPVIKESTPAFVDILKVGVPAFVDLIKTVAEFARTHKDLIHDIAAHPIGSLIAFEIGKAALPSLLQKLMSQAFATISGAGGGPSGGFGSLGKLGKATTVVGTGLLAGEMTKQWVDEGFNAESAKGNDRLSNQMAALNLTSAAKRGALTPEQRAQAEQLQQKLAADVQAARGDMENPSLVKKVTGTFANIVDPKGAQEAQTKEYAEQVKAIQASKKAMEDLAAALKENSQAVAGRGGNSGPSGAGRAEPVINR